MSKLLLFFVLVLYSFSEAHSRPPYDGTIFYFKDAINSSDPTAFQAIVYVGQDNRTMFDRRKNDWIKTLFPSNQKTKEKRNASSHSENISWIPIKKF